MENRLSAFKAAFPFTVPVMAGYLFLGTAFGILMSSKDFGLGWILLMSVSIFAGSMQFVAINLLTAAAAQPVNAFLLTLLVNARHLFYSISMLTEFGGCGKKKPYLIFGLTDETFSILCSAQPPDGVDKPSFMFAVTLLDQCYWVAGSMIGGVLGSLADLPLKGIDFVMTALFTVIFIEQWKTRADHRPALIGLGVSVLCLALLGPGRFIIPAMLLIVASLTMFRKSLKDGASI